MRFIINLDGDNTRVEVELPGGNTALYAVVPAQVKKLELALAPFRESADNIVAKMKKPEPEPELEPENLRELVPDDVTDDPNIVDAELVDDLARTDDGDDDEEPDDS